MVGYSFPILNWITGVQYIYNSHDLVQEGYEKVSSSAWSDSNSTRSNHKLQYQSAGLFRIAVYDGWLIVVTDPQLVEQVRSAPDSTLLFERAIQKTLQADHLLGPEANEFPYHKDVIRNTLTRNLSARFEDIRDEIEVAFKEEVCAEGGVSLLLLDRCLMRRRTDTEHPSRMEGD